MKTLPRAALSHIVMSVFDFEKMKDFYINTLGFSLSDSGNARGNDICFLTLDPELEGVRADLSWILATTRDADLHDPARALMTAPETWRGQRARGAALAALGKPEEAARAILLDLASRLPEEARG